MVQEPLISIIIPVYNGEKWLPRSLGSIEAQTFRNWECILIDDGSQDGSPIVCDEYAARDRRFHVIHQTNGGISAARNTGLEAAHGQYVTFCDQDDAFAPRLLEYALQVQQNEPDRLVWWNYTMTWHLFEQNFHTTLQYKCETRLEAEPLADYTRVFVLIWNKLFPRQLLEENKLRFNPALGKIGSLGEDVDFVEQYLNRVYGNSNFGLAHIELPVYYHEDNPSSLTYQSNRSGLSQSDQDPPAPNYCEKLEEEYQRKLQAVPTLFQQEPYAVAAMARSYLRNMAYGIWSAEQLGELLPCEAWKTPFFIQTMAWCQQHKLYLPYYLPLRLGWPWLIARYYSWDAQHSAWYFRLNWLFRKILFFWRDPPAIRQ